MVKQISKRVCRRERKCLKKGERHVIAKSCERWLVKKITQTLDVLLPCFKVNAGDRLIGLSCQFRPHLKEGFAPFQDFSALLFVLEKRSDELNCQSGTPEFIRELVRLSPLPSKLLLTPRETRSTKFPAVL